MILTLQLCLLKKGKPTYIEPVDDFLANSVVLKIALEQSKNLEFLFSNPSLNRLPQLLTYPKIGVYYAF